MQASGILINRRHSKPDFSFVSMAKVLRFNIVYFSFVRLPFHDFQNYSIYIMSLGKGFENPDRERKQFLFLECKLKSKHTKQTFFMIPYKGSRISHENTCLVPSVSDKMRDTYGYITSLIT